MKPLSFLLLVCASFLAILCSPDDDTTAQTFNIENENLITIEDNQSTFSLNDQITISTDIPNIQTDVNGNTVLLSDLFYSDILQESAFQHTLTLYRETGFGTLSEISVTNDDITINNGETNSISTFITTRSFYDPTTNSFKSSYAITLREAGRYFLSHSRFNLDNTSNIFISGGVFELGFAEIKTSIENENNEGAYDFEVIE